MLSEARARGVEHVEPGPRDPRPVGADAFLRPNLLVWGLGGVVAPFVGIKLIDMILVVLGLA